MSDDKDGDFCRCSRSSAKDRAYESNISMFNGLLIFSDTSHSHCAIPENFSMSWRGWIYANVLGAGGQGGKRYG
ncbi:hypothetical protein DAI22_12g113400 [Oryza sativa Japonica Group]|nr:hypothetical protein DAI22_12g113400 [Oryza sativa Japonica Group]